MFTAPIIIRKPLYIPFPSCTNLSLFLNSIESDASCFSVLQKVPGQGCKNDLQVYLSSNLRIHSTFLNSGNIFVYRSRSSLFEFFPFWILILHSNLLFSDFVFQSFFQTIVLAVGNHSQFLFLEIQCFYVLRMFLVVADVVVLVTTVDIFDVFFRDVEFVYRLLRKFYLLFKRW